MAKTEDNRNKRLDEAGEHGGHPATAGVPHLEPLLQVSNRLFEGWMAVGNELLEFGKSRLDRSLEMSRAMAQTTSLNEAIDVQAKFTRSAMQDYLSEANKLADLGTRSLIDSFSTLQRQGGETAQRAEAAE
jgi:phasin family protein